MINKADINAILKIHGLRYIKASNGEYGANRRDVVLEPRLKGFVGGSIGPLTVTDAHHSLNEDMQNKVYAAFNAMEGASVKRVASAFDSHRLQNIVIEVPVSAKVIRVIKFNWELFRSYTSQARFDPGYQTYWYVMTIEDRKI
jgi:hypothetical protein